MDIEMYLSHDGMLEEALDQMDFDVTVAAKARDRTF